MNKLNKLKHRQTNKKLHIRYKLHDNICDGQSKGIIENSIK